MDMIKRFIYMAAVAVAAFAMSSCNKQQEYMAAGDEVTVTFNVSADDVMMSKAVGGAVDYEKELQVYVYKDGKYLEDVAMEILDFGKNLKTSVLIKLVKGQKYDIVFWTQAEGNDSYSIDPEKGVMKVDYSDIMSNDDTMDAFYLTVKDYVPQETKLSCEVVLRRPFAQINVGTAKADFDDAGFAGVTFDGSGAVLENVADELDLLTGLASGSVSVEFKPADIIKEDLVIFKGTENEAKYEYMSMNYVLVGDGNTPGEKVLLKNCKVTFYDGVSPINTIDIPNVPVRRNWRTNIIGSDLLTQSSAFDIVIDPDFYGEYDYRGYDIDKVLYADSKTGEYLIENPAQLTFISEVVNEGYDDFSGKVLRLDGNLDLTGWACTPIGTNAYPFKGTFDGDGNVITGITVKEKGNAGLFGVLAGTVKNLTLSGASVSGSGYVGGLVGYLKGKVEKCAVNDSSMENTGSVATSATGSVIGCASASAECADISSNVAGLDLIGYDESK